MPDKVFSAETAEVEIYLDDGTGAPSGAALFECTYKRAVAIGFQSAAQPIPHAGYPNDEISPGKRVYVLDLGRALDNRDRDLRLTDALYFIRLTMRTDDYSQHDRYDCLKCRRADWRMPQADRGAVNVRARFLVESIVPGSAS